MIGRRRQTPNGATRSQTPAGAAAPPAPLASQADKRRITPERLRKLSSLITLGAANAYAPVLEAARGLGEINTPDRVRHWVAQLTVESKYFTSLTESLVYRSDSAVDRLAAFENVKKLAKEFEVTSHEMAKKIAAEAQKGGKYDQKYIGDIIYGDRDDLGNGAEEGYNYLGRGFIQITGKANYAEYGKMLNIDLVGDPKRAADPDVAAKVAAEFWRVHGCNALADVDDVAAITLVITGDRAHSHDQFAVRRRLAEAGRFIWLNADAIPLPANNPMPDRMPGSNHPAARRVQGRSTFL